MIRAEVRSLEAINEIKNDQWDSPRLNTEFAILKF